MIAKSGTKKRGLMDSAFAARMLGNDAVPRWSSKRTVEYGPICERWLAGETQSDIARDVGISRERVRQIVMSSVPVWEQRLRGHRKQAGDRLHELGKRGRACIMCARWFLPRECDDQGCALNGFCSRGHQRAWVLLRYHINPEQREKQRRLVAKNSTSETYRRNMAAGTVRQKGRWFARGSKTFAVARLAYREHWPVFDLLHPRQQAQVIAAVAGTE